MASQPIFPIDEAQLTSVITEGIFYGLVLSQPVVVCLKYRFTLSDITQWIILSFVHVHIWSYNPRTTGINLVTFFACIHDLLISSYQNQSLHTIVLKPRKEIHINMLFGALCLLSFATLDLAAGIRLNLRVFLSLRGNTVEDFGDISYWVNVLKMVSFVGQIFTGDSILVSWLSGFLVVEPTLPNSVLTQCIILVV